MALRLRFNHPLRSFRASADLTVERGETVALVGPSGAGKTTVLRVVAGLLRPDEGVVTLDDVVLLDTNRRIDVPPEHRRVGYLFQEYALFPHLDVWHNVRFGARTRAGRRLRCSSVSASRSSPALGSHELSGGERQRVALARALARDPALLLLDEPLSALDAHTRAGVRAELRELLDGLGLPTILVTHDFEDAATLAHRVGVISRRRDPAARHRRPTSSRFRATRSWRASAARPFFRGGGRGARRAESRRSRRRPLALERRRRARRGQRRRLPVGRLARRGMFPTTPA